MKLFNPFAWIDHTAKSAVAHLVPASMRAELGDFAHALVANIAYDAKALGVELEHIAASDIETIWETVKQVAVSMGPKLLGEAFAGNVGKAVSQLGSAEVKAVLPQLTLVGQTTLSTMMHTAASMVVSGVLTANPTSAPASSQAASSPASSAASSKN
jgi:hypothetical protein